MQPGSAFHRARHPKRTTSCDPNHQDGDEQGRDPNSTLSIQLAPMEDHEQRNRHSETEKKGQNIY